MTETVKPKRPPLTPQQHAAVVGRNTSISLSAGAGSGKTHVLTQRFLSHLDPSGPDAGELANLQELVAITFTDAAAREMRDRVRKACYERLLSATEETQEYWYKLMRSLDSARISTIHAFCTTLLRRHAVETGLDPRFGVLEENQADVLRTELLDDLLRTKLEKHDESILQMSVVWGITGLRQRLLSAMRHSNKEGFSSWANASVNDLLDAWENHLNSDEYQNMLSSQVKESPLISEMLQLLQVAEVDHPKFDERRSFYNQ